MLETIIRLILRASLTAGIAAAAVMLIRLPLKKAPKRWSYILWAVVFFRCLCPLSVESAVSIFNAVPERAETQQVSDDYEYVPVDYDPVYVDYSGNADFNKPSVSEKSVRKDPGSVYTILFIVWVSGAAAMLLYAVISYVGLMVKMKTAIRTENGVYETDIVSTAFSAGLFPPKIFLPEGLSEKERELIIAHERVHIKRLDFLTKPIAFAGLALHWFNPMVWMSFALMTKDMELSCDEAVLKILGTEEKKSYSQALLKVSMERSGLTALPLAFAGSGIKERVKNVLGYKKPKLVAAIIAAVVVLTAGVMLGTDAVRNVGDEEVFSETLVEGSIAEVTNSNDETLFIMHRPDDTDVGLKHLLVYYDDTTMVFEGGGFGKRDIDIDNIDPDKIEKAVICDMRIDHYDDYDGDGVNDDLIYIAVEMELYMAEDNDRSPKAEYSSSYMENNSVVTKMCGGNEKQYDMYFEIEVPKHGNGFCGYGIQLVGFGDAEIYVRDNKLKIADFPHPEVMMNAEKSIPARAEVSLVPEDSFEWLFKKYMDEEDITVEFLSDTDIRIIFDRDLEELEWFTVFDILDFMESNFYPDYELNFSIQTPSDDIVKVDENERQRLWTEREEHSRREIEERKLSEKESAVQQLETAVAVREPEKMTYEINKIIFPAHELDKTEYNARIFEIPKFTASFALPLGWTTGIPADGEKRFCDNLWSPVNIYNENGELMGTIAFNTFEIYDDTTEENYYRMVYNQIMLGSVVSWDEGYTPLKTDPDSNGEAAATKVRVRDDETREETYYPAVLAYDNDLLVYIGIQFDVDAVTEQQLFHIVASVTLS